MITSWEEFFIAVEQMRECQKEYKKANSMSAAHAAYKCEAEVDEAIERKRAEWEQSQVERKTGGAQ